VPENNNFIDCDEDGLCLAVMPFIVGMALFSMTVYDFLKK